MIFTVNNYFGVMILSVPYFTVCHQPDPFEQHAFSHKNTSLLASKNVVF